MSEQILQIPLKELHAFRNHPFQVKEDEELRDLAQSIRENGVLSPAIARPRKNGGYELVSGHRRKAACELAGLGTIPLIVRELDDNEAVIIMVDSNKQREHLLPSEKAFAYKMKLDAIKRQGKRQDLTSGQIGPKLENQRSNQEVAQDSNESVKQIQRYIRLTKLNPEIRAMVDERQIAFNPAVELSYLPRDVQALLLDAMQALQCTPSLSQATRLKRLQQRGEMEIDKVFAILSETKANQRERLCFTLEKLKPYFPPGFTPKQMERAILGMLDERLKSAPKIPE